MVATLILHSRADLDWATALASELSEHAPVRLQLAANPPKAMIGPSVVRVALWSPEAAGEGAGATLAALLGAEPAHSVLVRRGDCDPPPGLDTALLADAIEVQTAKEAAMRLRETIPRVGAVVAEIVKTARQTVENAREKRLRRADTALLLVVLAGLGSYGFFANWGGLRTALTGHPAPVAAPEAVPATGG